MFSDALDHLARLHTLVKQGRAYLSKRLDDPDLKPETETYEKYGKRPSNPPPRDVWQDIFAKYLSLADPQQALTQWDRWGSVELGDTRTATLHWLLNLQAMGTPDFAVTADTSLYAVFKRADGKRTYLAFNAGKAPLTVRFSDGKQLLVAPGTLGTSS